MGLNVAGACGALANIFKESGFNPLASGDKGTSFGICQWHNERKTALINYCRENGLDHNTVEGQLWYLKYELERSYEPTLSALMNASNNSTGAYSSASTMCSNFERPADVQTKSRERGILARDTYYALYKSDTTTYESLGEEIVELARSMIGTPYGHGDEARGPDKFDSSGLVQYVYSKAAGMTLPRTAIEQSTVEGTSYTVPTSVKAGDIFFFKGDTRSGSGKISMSAIAVGSGGKFIGCMDDSVKEWSLSDNDDYYKSIFAKGMTVLSADSTFGSADTSYISSSPTDTITGLADGLPLSRINQYEEALIDALDVITKAGDSYGVLVDLKHNKEFKFHIPQSFSESYPVSWSSPGNVLGRTAPVLGYESTGARSIALDLHLYAGEGYYKPSSSSDNVDYVEKLHEDLAFLESLEYPDYSSAIIEPPPVVLLSLGESVKIKGVIQGLNIVHSRPFDSKNRAMSAHVSFTVTQCSDDPPGYLDILNRTTKSY